MFRKVETPGGGVARNLYAGTLAVGLLIVLAAGLPGHMTTDSVIQLAEGRAGEQQSFNPAFMSWLLGRFDSLLSGTALFVAFSVALLFGALAALPRLAGRVHVLAAPVLALVILSPQVLIYQGAVWKDVFFANSAIAGTVLLAISAERGALRGAGLAAWVSGLVLLVVAALVRQNGVLALGAAALAFGLAAGFRHSWRRGLGATAAVLTAGLVLFLAVGLVMTRVMPSTSPQAAGAGLRVIQHFDLVGVAARDPNASFAPLEAADPRAAATLRSLAPQGYNPERVDTIGNAPGLGETLWQTPEGAVARTWTHVAITEFPDYAAHRLEVFRQAFLTPDLLACLPVTTGVQGPEAVLEELGMPSRQDRRDRELYNYATWFFDTPVLSHLTYALLSLGVMVALVLRGRPSDWVMAGLQAGALAFAGSFLVIALACDYRYLYFLDLAALFGLVHLALDPPWAAIRRRFQT
ncbi:MAG: hypothetical protein IM653_09660 [Phenylobacterium sp.]|nr:hypothetical protein [Phenylobacterium sp.]MCA6225000.1 hypothetical protein [Phenylobacterium sp.]MCA6230747.1 hypothetical protein [Phenylobacterium sp.]MCA6235387.1 hypothetical protein [Phenylobacterium sp.]MCA6248386.1 hypothetical protein [Phenylobacterium sp.]MCA6252232.1 hypothetical protein [Phenylobacterium sp.]